jgi:hypothetical protein
MKTQSMDTEASKQKYFVVNQSGDKDILFEFKAPEIKVIVE